MLYDPRNETIFPNIPDPEPGARPLYYVAFCGFDGLVEHLTLKRPQYVSARGSQSGTALHSASAEGYLPVDLYLLWHGVNANVRDSTNDAPLLLASWKGHRDVKADVDLLNNDYHAPLACAAFYGHTNVAQLVLEHNAEANSQDKNGHTPLHNVLRRGWKADPSQIVQLLLEHGANPNTRNNQHRTPLHQVSKRGDLFEVLGLLLEHGADLNAEDKDGKTPLQLVLDRIRRGCAVAFWVFK